MDPFGWKTTLLALAVASALAIRSQRKQTLTKLGSIAGFVVGFLLISTGLRGMVLVYFYQLGSWATKYKHQYKSQLDATVEQHSMRGARQVLAVSFLATLLSLYHAVMIGSEQPIQFAKYHETSEKLSFLSLLSSSHLACAVLAHHATSLADTWASELGMVWGSSSPILITQPWRHVPPGTNGGITFEGCLCSIAGGVVIAILTLFMDWISGVSLIQPIRIILFGGCCGLLGSLLDSILGATVQITYLDVETKQVTSEAISSSSKHPPTKRICGRDWLTNEQVNLVSTLLTTWIGGWILGPLMLQ